MRDNYRPLDCTPMTSSYRMYTYFPCAALTIRIKNWPEPKNLTELRGFLGTCGVVRTFIKNYAQIARPLVQLTRKGVEFEIGEKERQAIQALKDAVIHSPALKPIEYDSEEAVILAVDSSVIGFGYVLYQEGTVNGRKTRFVSRFGSGNWNERESNYSQPKIELYGLLRALKAVRVHIIGVKNLIVEVDAKYIKGMINNPDMQPNATINRWIAGILLFEFKLVHVPGIRHGGPDGLSRRTDTDEEADEDQGSNHEDWIDDMYCFAQEDANIDTTNPMEPIPYTEEDLESDKRLTTVRKFLEGTDTPQTETEKEMRKFVRYASNFFLSEGRLFRKHKMGHHQVVPPANTRHELIRQAHDEMGHKGVYTVWSRLTERFWWPHMDRHIKWFVKTCHACQTRSFRKYHIPPIIAEPAPLFRKAYVDTMLMPKAGSIFV